MVLACFDHVEFYQSENLLTWRYSGEFGGGEGSPAGVWECPDLFCLPVAEKPDESRWVLAVSVNDGRRRAAPDAVLYRPVRRLAV